MRCVSQLVLALRRLFVPLVAPLLLVTSRWKRHAFGLHEAVIPTQSNGLRTVALRRKGGQDFRPTPLSDARLAAFVKPGLVDVLRGTTHDVCGVNAPQASSGVDLIEVNDGG